MGSIHIMFIQFNYLVVGPNRLCNYFDYMQVLEARPFNYLATVQLSGDRPFNNFCNYFNHISNRFNNLHNVSNYCPTISIIGSLLVFNVRAADGLNYLFNGLPTECLQVFVSRVSLICN